jgi:hypothetical protein
VIEKIFPGPGQAGFSSGYGIRTISLSYGLVMVVKELGFKSPISKRRECLIKFILMRVPIENGLGF